MATDLESRKSPSRAETLLRKKFAELGTRIQRFDCVANLLTLLISIASYASSFAVFDWVAGNASSPAVSVGRWSIVGVFFVAFVFLFVRTLLGVFRRVNPYYLAQRLEQTVPEAKNSLINWLDLHEEGLPSAFQKNLSTRAAEAWEEADARVLIPRRKNGILLGVFGVVLLGLMVLVLLDPAGFLASMRRAFVPIHAPPPPARTQLTLLQPEGDTEIMPDQSVSFAARIAGRVPAENRPDSPRVQWRYHPDEDWNTLPLVPEPAGTWSTQLAAERVRTGFQYKLSAGDAETPIHEVRVRARAHIANVEIRYRHRPFRKLPQMPAVIFPNEHSARPIVHGPRGSEVEMLVRTSRPIREARVEFVANQIRKDLPIEMRADETAFVCRFPLEQTGQFRVLYTARDGEENVDRQSCDVLVQDDPLPIVVLTRPGKEMAIPCNSSFVLEGTASSGLGIRGLALRMRVLSGADKNLQVLPLPYRLGTSFQRDDGSYPNNVEYMELVKLDEIKTDRSAKHTFAPGTVLEYWLEASDAADFPDPNGNVGKSLPYHLKLLDPVANPAQEQARRAEASRQQNAHHKHQDDKQAKDNKAQQEKKGNGGSGGSDPEQAANQMKKEMDSTQQKLQNALPDPKTDRGSGKGAKPDNADAKPNQTAPDAPEAQQKGTPMTSPDEAGQDKQPGGNGAGAGQPRPENREGAPSDGSPQGSGKGIDQQGPGRPDPAQQAMKSEAPPPLSPKSGDATAPGAAKADQPGGSPGSAASPGTPRGDSPTSNPKQPTWDEIAKKLDDLRKNDATSEYAGKDLADIGKNAEDSRKRQIAQDILEKNGRDPKTGKKAPNPFGSGGKSPGIGDDLKASAANRLFAARIGQMQLDDWKKRVTPDVLKKAGMTEAEWQRYVKTVQAYDGLVHQWNAQIARKALRELSGPRSAPGSRLNVVESAAPTNTGAAPIALPPAELRDAQKRFTTQP